MGGLFEWFMWVGEGGGYFDPPFLADILSIILDHDGQLCISYLYIRIFSISIFVMQFMNNIMRFPFFSSNFSYCLNFTDLSKFVRY